MNRARRRALSATLRRVGEVAAGERIAALVALVVALWLAAYAVSGFPEWMATSLQVAAAAVTLVMVFVIQHAQRRHETAIQIKLDALVHSSDAADELAGIEHDDDIGRWRELADRTR